MFCIGLGGCFVPVLTFDLLNVLICCVANRMKSMFIKSMDDIEVGRPGNVLEDRIRI